MRILIVSLNYAPEPTGIGPYTSGLAEYLLRSGHDVRVISGVPHYPEWRNVSGAWKLWAHDWVREVPVLRVRHYIPNGGVGAKRLVMEGTFALGVLFSRWGRPDVVVTVSPSLAASAAVVARGRARKTPVVVWIQDFYGRGLRELKDGGGWSSSAASLLEAKTMGHADGVIVIHDRFARQVENDWGLDRERVFPIRNWVHLERGEEPRSQEESKRFFGWQGRPVVMHTGNMGRKQGLELLVEAGKEAERTGDQTLYVLLGDGSERSSLEEAALGCRNIRILSPVPDREFSIALNAADILVVCERVGVREMALPSKLTTYFAAGKAVVAAVASDGVTAQEVRAAKAGVVVRSVSATGLRQVVGELMGNDELRAQLGKAGRVYADSLDAAEVLSRFVEVLRLFAKSGATSGLARVAVPTPRSP